MMGYSCLTLEERLLSSPTRSSSHALAERERLYARWTRPVVDRAIAVIGIDFPDALRLFELQGEPPATTWVDSARSVHRDLISVCQQLDMAADSTPAEVAARICGGLARLTANELRVPAGVQLGQLARTDLDTFFAARYLEIIRDAVKFYAALRPLSAHRGTVDHMRSSGLAGLLTHFPMLNRLLGTCRTQLVDSVSSALHHLSIDAESLGLALPAFVDRIRLGLSDPHAGGRTVVALRIQPGRRIIYKPRSLAMEAFWSSLADLINRTDVPIEVGHARTWDKTTHGWMEAVVHNPEYDTTSGARNAGGMLGLAALLGLTDLHCENVIASSGVFTPVDMECAITPAWTGIGPSLPALFQAASSTGLLPTWLMTGQRVQDVSGFFGSNGSSSKNLMLDESGSNILLNEGALGPFLDGFDAVVSWWRSSTASELLPSVLKARRVVRETDSYSRVLRQSYHPRALQSGLDWGLSLAFHLDPMEMVRGPAWKSVYRSELAQLRNLDIPRFEIDIDERHLRDVHGVIVLTDARTPREEWLESVALVAEEKKGVMTALEQILVAANVKATDAKSSTSAVSILIRSDGMSPEETVIHGIWRRLQKFALKVESNAVWLAPALGNAGEWQLRALSRNLYDGLPGVAIFLAAYARLFQNAEAGELASSAIRYFLASYVTRRPQDLHDYALGAYGVRLAAWLLGAEEVTRVQLDNSFAGDLSRWEHVEVVNGLAGALIGFCDSPSADAIRGEIVRRAQPDQRGTFFPGSAGVVTGASHGNSGIARCLAASGATPCVISSIVQYENTCFESSIANWRVKPDGEVRGSWCHGAPGIVMMRATMANEMSHELAELRMDTDVARAASRLGQLAFASHNYCCGAAGIMDALLLAGSFFESQVMLQSAAQIGRAVANEALSRGRLDLPHGPVELPQLGFFTGESGVGYALLRAMDSTLPCVGGFALPWRDRHHARPPVN